MTDTASAPEIVTQLAPAALTDVHRLTEAAS